MNMMVKITLILMFIAIILVGVGTADEKKPSRQKNERDSCVSCHEQLKNNLKKPVDEWRTSVHAGGGKCSRCHGGDPSANDKLKAKSRLANYIGKPEKKAVSEFCGREACHSKALEQFKRGPHYQSVLRTSEPSCTSCHGVHNIQRSSVNLISSKSCAACHPQQYAKDIVALIAGIDKGIDSIDKNISYLREKHAEVQPLQKRLDNVRHLFHQFVHVFSRQDMEYTKRLLEIEMSSLDTETKSKVSGIQRIDLLYIAMVIFGLGIIGGVSLYMLIMYNKRQ